ncbi:MAG: hypothetical protein J6C55_03655 [Oscillospiraceae bacterium]|nr:hypothetical protein [Oscillospiraceae bacterium]
MTDNKNIDNTVQENLKQDNYYYKIKNIKFNKIFNKKRAVTLLGLAIMFFSFVGVIVSFKTLYTSTVRIITRASEKEKFEKYILPVLMFDPVPFDNIKTVDKISILRSAIWAAFINNGKEKYLNERYNTLIVPVSDVDVSLASLFGSKIKIKHQTFGDGFMNNYIYDKKSQTYTVPMYDQFGVYSPYVKKINKNKKIYILTVGYIRPADVWQTYVDEKNNEMRPVKYMKYILKKIDDGYNIIAIKDLRSS